MKQPKEGDYVLATKYRDGSPCDHFCVGFYKGCFNTGCAIRHDVVDSQGNLYRGNGFRRVELITESEGEALVKLFPEISDKLGKSLWWHLDCIRGVINPHDSCGGNQERVDE